MLLSVSEPMSNAHALQCIDAMLYVHAPLLVSNSCCIAGGGGTAKLTVMHVTARILAHRVRCLLSLQHGATFMLGEFRRGGRGVASSGGGSRHNRREMHANPALPHAHTAASAQAYGSRIRSMALARSWRISTACRSISTGIVLLGCW